MMEEPHASKVYVLSICTTQTKAIFMATVKEKSDNILAAELPDGKQW